MEASADIALTSDLGQTILVVDDEQTAQSYFRRLLVSQGYTVHTAHDGPSALQKIADTPPDVVLLDVKMPGGLSGFDVCREIRREPATRLTPVVIVTGFDGRDERVRGIEVGADAFLAKPVDSQELLAQLRSLIRVKQYTDDLDSAAAIIMTLATMIEARDGYGEGHCHRMANYATRLGRALALGAADVQTLYRGAFLHDIGMLAIPDAVLNKRSGLEPDEYERVKSHTILGDRLCGNLRSMHAVRPIVRSHHERLDGSGYPDGLRGDDIPLVAQIVGVIDVYEAVTSQRAYQNPLPPEQAMAVLRRNVECGRQRSDLVETFICVLDESGTGQ
jgi:putative two-component system response regulator